MKSIVGGDGLIVVAHIRRGSYVATEFGKGRNITDVSAARKGDGGAGDRRQTPAIAKQIIVVRIFFAAVIKDAEPRAVGSDGDRRLPLVRERRVVIQTLRRCPCAPR